MNLIDLVKEWLTEEGYRHEGGTSYLGPGWIPLYDMSCNLYVSDRSIVIHWDWRGIKKGRRREIIKIFASNPNLFIKLKFYIDQEQLRIKGRKNRYKYLKQRKRR